VAQSSSGPGLPPNAGRNRLALLALLTIYLAVTLMYGQFNPLGEASDELAHMGLIRFIGEEGHLPRNETERQAAGYKSDSPMLYHILVGVATGWIDYDVLPHLKVNDLSPRHILINDGLSPFAVIHTDDETFPYQGIVLSWHLARLISTLISLGTLVVIYLIVLRIRPDAPWLALGVTALAAAIPQFHFIASSVNDDNLLGLLSALFLLTLLQAWRHPEHRRTYALLGLWFGLALTTKYTVVAFFPLVLVVLARAIHRRELSWGMAASRFFIFGATAAVVAAWWLIYVEWYFNEIPERGLIAGLVKPLSFDTSTEQVTSLFTGRPSTFSAGDAGLWDWATRLFQSFWFVPWEANATLTAVLSLALLGLCILAVMGLWRGWHRDEELPWPVLGLLALQIGLLLPIPLLRFYLTLNPAEAGQGRHILFPAAAAVGVLVTCGVAAWFPAPHRRFAGPVLGGILLVFSLVSMFGFILPGFPPRLPVRTASNALEGIPNPLHVTFEEGIELVGYEIGEVNPYGALPVTLIWHSLAHTSRDYLVELSLVDQEGMILSLWLGHPADGRYPTRAWEPGEVIRDTIWLPLAGIAGGDYHLALRLQSPSETVPPSGNQDKFTLADVTLPSSPARVPLYSLETTGEGSVNFDIWQAGQPVTGVPKYRYRAAIPITFVQSPTSDLKGQAEISLVGPDGTQRFPQTQAGNTYIFLVDAYWPSGKYKLRVKETDHRIESEPVLRAQVRPRNFDVPPMSAEVHANFGDEITLLGYDFPDRKTQPGGALPITVYWQALRPIDQHYIVSNHLLYGADMHQWGGRDRVPQDYYSTVLWTPGEVVRDEYLVPVDSSAPPGVYRLDLGLYVEVAGQSWHLPLVQNGTALDANSVTIVPIKVGGPPPGITVENPSPAYPGSINLAGLVTFLGYDMSLDGEVLELTLYWRVDAPLPADYTTFVHIRDSTGGITGKPGTIVAQMDRPPADGAYPTSLWDAGEVIQDAVQILIPPQTPPGDYEVVIGLYDAATGQRLPVLDDQGRPIGDHIPLEQEITVR
jgi:hypothetical protein